MYELYRIDRKSFRSYEMLCDLGTVEECKVSTKISGWKSCLYWNVITLGMCRVYVFKNKRGENIHYSYVIQRNWKFPFMKKGDFEIGPCATKSEYRGQGIYPYVLSVICKHKLAEGNAGYMIIEEKNFSSQRGVTKCGFKKAGSLRKDWLKRYVKGK